MLKSTHNDYWGFDMYGYGASYYLKCLETCILDVKCYAIVNTVGMCYFKNIGYNTSGTVMSCYPPCYSFLLG